MRKALNLTTNAVAVQTAAMVQDAAKAECFLGYTYVRVNSATDVPAYSSNGGSRQLALKFSRYVSGVIDLGGYHNDVVAGHTIDNTIFSYLFGPRVSMRNHRRVTPYFNPLFGGVWMSASTVASATPASTSAPSDRSGKSKSPEISAAEGSITKKGGVTAETTVTVKKRPAVTATRLPDIVFPERSARVNNCGKRVLIEEMKSFIERDPGGNIVLTSHINSGESATANLDQQRALKLPRSSAPESDGCCSTTPNGAVKPSERAIIRPSSAA